MLLKYADDMALVAHLTGTNALSEYHQAANNLVWTFRESSPELNIAKTKELCCVCMRVYVYIGVYVCTMYFCMYF